MKRLLCLLLAVAMTLALCACGDDGGRRNSHIDRDDTQRGNQIGDLAYGTSLTEISEDGIALTTFNPTELGKITVLNFWAYWCPPCVGELPHFEKAAEEYADEVAIVAVHCDELSKAQEFIGQNHPDSPIRFAMDDEDDPYGYYELLGGTGSIPYTVVLDADGVICKTFVGAITYDKLVDAIEDCRERQEDSDTKATQITIATTTNQPDSIRGNEVGSLCYGADLAVIDENGKTGETINPAQLGKCTLIYFWGTWCAPTVTTLSSVSRIAEENQNEIAVVAVHCLTGSSAPSFIADNYPNSSITFAIDNGERENEYYTLLNGAGNTPYILLLDENGIIVKIWPHSVTYENLLFAVESCLQTADGM